MIKAFYLLIFEEINKYKG